MFVKQILCSKNKTLTSFFVTAARGIQQNAAPHTLASDQSFTPVQIQVPWGKIEGKLWGSGKKQPILAIHGWMDNAGSFDPIIPFLKNSTVLAIDLPGHGLSSWLPRGTPYSEDIYCLAIRAVVKSFGWDKVKLLSHSLGGLLSYHYAHLFPEETQFLVSIDAIPIISDSIIQHSKFLAKGIDKYLELDKIVSDIPPSYPEDVAIHKWMQGTVFRSLDLPSTKTLMIRGAKKKEDGTYFYTRDIRLRIGGFGSYYTPETLRQKVELITCPLLLLRATETPHERNKYMAIILESLNKTSKELCVVDVQGSHHVHMMQPEVVAKKIVPFLEKYDI